MQEDRTTLTQAVPGPAADYPSTVAAWVAESIPELEAGLHDGTLSELIERPDVQEAVGPALVHRYRTLASEKLKHDPAFRAAWTGDLTAVCVRSLQTPQKLFAARVKMPPGALKLWNITDALPPAIVAVDLQGKVALRPEQVLSARAWGIWFAFEDDLLERFYMNFLVQRALQRLASNIINLWNLEAIHRSGHLNKRMSRRWKPGVMGPRFEQLMLDVLNEWNPVARQAPLAEDILEHTDLRVAYSTVNPARSSRVQVSLTSDPKRHARKVKAIPLSEEYIIITPLELARCAIHPPTHPFFADFPWNDFWEELGGRWRDVHALALELHDLFVAAMSWPLVHPLGPLWSLPPLLRRFIRRYTEHRAAKANHYFRERLERSPRMIGPVEKCTGSYWRDRFCAHTSPPRTGR